MRDPIPSSAESPIRGLTRLVESLKDSPVLSQPEIRHLLSDLNIETSDSDVQVFLQFDRQNYCRNFVLHTPTIQVLVLCWSPGQASKIHDHGKSDCGLRVLSGSATETIYQGTLDECTPTEKTALEPGAIRVSPLQ